jgi:hypothetical protein
VSGGDRNKLKKEKKKGRKERGGRRRVPEKRER